MGDSPRKSKAMQVRVIDNTGDKLISTLTRAVEGSKDIKIAAAFASRSGLAMLEPAIEVALRAQAYLDFIIGLDMSTTEPAALRLLYDLSLSNSTVSLSCFTSEASAGIYHPKLYLFRSDNSVTSVIGSSNLTG